MLFDAIVLAGGDNRRMAGVDKAMLDVGGEPILARVLAGVTALGIELPIVVGPCRALATDVRWCREDPPGGGPVAALAAATALRTAPGTLTLAADLPFVSGVLGELTAALPGHDVAVLIDAAGRRNLLAAAWRTQALLAQLATQPAPGRSMRSLFEGMDVIELNDPGGAADDCDTPGELAQARERAP